MADNGTGAAQAKGEAAAQSAPTAPQPSDADIKNGGAKTSTTPTEPVVTAASADNADTFGKLYVADPAVVVSSDQVEVHPDATGGQSFDYGQKDGEKPARDESNAQKFADYEAAVRQENPDKVLYREAGTGGRIGGESFDYGQKPKADN
jgi:hypothetical protein